MIRAIYHLRFANSFVEPLLNRENVESISIVMKEKFGAEGRGGYFDEFGMIRDVGQNREWSPRNPHLAFSDDPHRLCADLLQAISIMTMNAPTSMSTDSLRDNKVQLLKEIPPIKPSDLVLGQYGKGDDGQKSYVDDETVPDDSKTATFAQWAKSIETDRWRGVPVLVKCGKGE
jgi:glucose-6-phosphate 1-dehydrogenase